MTIAPAIARHFSSLNEEQRQIIAHADGPLMIIAGPGSGKTYSIVLRALNLLLQEKATVKEIVLCTFTEKAALEMRERFAAAARQVGYKEDLSELRVSTIHGFCNRVLMQYRHRTWLRKNYTTLDELTQLLFIFEHYKDIIETAGEHIYPNRWRTRWTAIKGVRDYFNKITEELVDAKALIASGDDFLAAIGAAYLRYQKALQEDNRVDFAHLQHLMLNLLQDEAIAGEVSQGIRYVLVDEYQDTNYIQQQLVLKLSEHNHNLCVVGDEDQSIYRFRGATVRNILEFPKHFSDCQQIQLTTNYRSHRKIVEAYDKWMASADWSNRRGTPFRHNKTIKADPAANHTDYPAVISIRAGSKNDEAKRFAQFVKFLKENNVISDYSQVALLLHSVKEEHSSHYIEALGKENIPAFCPRARAFFDIPEIGRLVACFALIFGWHGENRGEVAGAVEKLAYYVDDRLVELLRLGTDSPLVKAVRGWIDEIEKLQEGKTLDTGPIDYFYRLLALPPFITDIKNENIARSLSIFSKLIREFQSYYRYSVVTHNNRNFIKFSFFASFLRLLYAGGINEYEDGDNPFPRGYVQIMTIHQAKGLEFPVVAVGSLSAQLSSQKGIDRVLTPFYHRPPFEPENRITNFDRMRLHYVAFSRPQKILILTAHDTPKPYFAPIYQNLPQLPYIEHDLIAAQYYELRERIPIKKSYSFTTDLALYETCPRQYQFFREYDFSPSRQGAVFFGLLVHETIEEIHRIVIDGGLPALDKTRIRELFDSTFNLLIKRDIRPVGEKPRELAFTQIMNYFNQNQEEMQRVQEVEVDVSLEKDGYILSGTVDLLLGGDGKRELLDFKTSQRPQEDAELIDAYKRQLCTYAHILQQRHGKHVDRLILYWTSEARKEDAMMVLPYEPAQVEQAGQHFDKVVQCIQAKEFQVQKPPERKICNACDMRMLCRNEGIIPPR